MTEGAESGGRRKIKPSSTYGFKLWKSERLTEGCKVMAYVDATGLWQTVAIIAASRHAASEIARLVDLLNGSGAESAMVRSALELFQALETEGLNFATEMELDDLIEKLEKACQIAIHN